MDEPAGSDTDDAHDDQRGLSRRAVLLGGAATVVVVAAGAAALVESEVLPGKRHLDRLLGQAPPAGSIPDVDPGPRDDGSFDSSARGGQATGWSVSYPPGSSVGDRLPVLISLHGKGGNNQSSWDSVGLDRFLAAHVDDGGEPFAIAAVDAGDTYYHDRADGTDSGAMVATELVPLLADHGLDTSRLGLIGISMGGYGALWLTVSGQLQPRAVGTMSAALWTAYGASAPGAFDDEADFDAHDVFPRRSRLTGVPLRVDCGTDDPFVGANRELVSGIDPRPDGGFEPGYHDVDYWTRVIPDQLAFLGPRLTG